MYLDRNNMQKLRIRIAIRTVQENLSVSNINGTIYAVKLTDPAT